MQADTKISNDLAVLKEKMNLLDSMIHPTDSSVPRLSVKTNEAVRSVVGYLDACGPRMIELVTACMSSQQDGVLSEAVFGDVLACNDRLQKLLGDVDTLLLTETPASTTAASAATATAPASEDLLTDQFGDLLLGDDNNPFAEDTATLVATAGAKTTGEDEEDAKQPAAAAPVAAPPAPPAEKDPFDDFFAERNTGF